MSNKLDPVDVLKDALKEAVEQWNNAKNKVDSTEAFLLKHQQESRDRGEVVGKLHMAINKLSSTPDPYPTQLTEEEIMSIREEELGGPFGYAQDDNPHVAKTEFFDPFDQGASLEINYCKVCCLNKSICYCDGKRDADKTEFLDPVNNPESVYYKWKRDANQTPFHYNPSKTNCESCGEPGCGGCFPSIDDHLRKKY